MNEVTQGFTEAERRQIITVVAALVLSGCAVVCLSLASRRVSLLRGWLSSSQWRMRFACAAFMGSYKMLSRLQGKAEEHGQSETPPDSASQPAG